MNLARLRVIKEKIECAEAPEVSKIHKVLAKKTQAITVGKGDLPTS